MVDDNTNFLFTILEKPVDQQRQLQLIPKAQKHKRRSKWKKEIEKDWAKKRHLKPSNIGLKINN